VHDIVHEAGVFALLAGDVHRLLELGEVIFLLEGSVLKVLRH